MGKKAINDMTTVLATRRKFLGAAGLGLGLAGLIRTQDVFSMAQEEEGGKVNQTVSEHARRESLPADAFDLPRWVPEHTGPYDLGDPYDNHFAFAKAQANLSGDYYWLAQYGWILICPPGEPAYPFLGRLTLAKVFVTPADPSWAPDVGEFDYTMWATFTTTHVDPRDFSPVSRKFNPYIGRNIDIPTIHYADRLVYRLNQSIIVPGVDPAFYTQPWDEEGGFSQHRIDTGDEVTYTVLGSAQKPGPLQPRCDVGFWTVNRDELMDPAKRAIDTRRDYSVIQKVTEYAWYGVEPGDPAQLLVHLTGMKTHDPSRMPSFIRTHVMERFPDRFLKTA